MTIETLSGGLPRKDIEMTGSGLRETIKSIPRKLFGALKSGEEHNLTISGQVAPEPSTPSTPDMGTTGIAKEVSPSERYIVADILPLDPNSRETVVTGPDAETIMEWADDPDVKGKIYQLESGPGKLYKEEGQRKYLYYEYYYGRQDDEGNPTFPENSTFFKAVNSQGEMIGVTTVRWKGVDFVKRGRTAYRERTIVHPEFREKKIALAMSVKVLDDIFYNSDKYDGQPATEVRSSIYTDRSAKRHDINHNYLTLLGFKKHDDPIWVRDRQVQPYRMSLSDYEKARPNVIEHLRTDQPKIAKHLEEQGKIYRTRYEE